MNEIWLHGITIVAAALAGFVASFSSNYLKKFLSSTQDPEVIRLKKGKSETDIPHATDFETLQSRMDALSRVSPRLAILDGWSLIASSIINRASMLETANASKGDVVTLAKALPGVDTTTIAGLENLRSYRNIVAHALDMPQHADLQAAVSNIVPLLRKITPQFDVETVNPKSVDDLRVR